MDMRKRMKELAGMQAKIVETAKAENRAITDEEKTLFDNYETEIVGCENSLEIERKIAARQKEDREPVNHPDVRVKGNPPKWSNFGEFLGTVASAAGPDRQVDNRLIDIKNQSGMNEGVGAEGGFLVETDHSRTLISRVYETGALASRANKIAISPNANGLTINAVDEQSRARGNRWGGVTSFWTQEAGQKQPSMPAFRQMEMKLKKLIGLCYATDELLQDTTALESIVTQAFTEEFGFTIDEAFLRGTGAGQPLGILNSPAFVAVPAEAGQPAGTILYENIVNMWSRCWAKSRANAVWFVNQACEPQLFSMSLPVGVGGVPVYMPANGIAGSPYGTLMGRPVIPIEQTSQVGTVGDIILADMSQYLAIDKGGIQQAGSIHVRFIWDEQVFRFVYRVDGQLTWNAPLTPANGGPTLSPVVGIATRP